MAARGSGAVSRVPRPSERLHRDRTERSSWNPTYPSLTERSLLERTSVGSGIPRTRCSSSTVWLGETSGARIRGAERRRVRNVACHLRSDASSGECARDVCNAVHTYARAG
jgi:hypothetical protein